MMYHTQTSPILRKYNNTTIAAYLSIIMRIDVDTSHKYILVFIITITDVYNIVHARVHSVQHGQTDEQYCDS